MLEQLQSAAVSVASIMPSDCQQHISPIFYCITMQLAFFWQQKLRYRQTYTSVLYTHCQIHEILSLTLIRCTALWTDCPRFFVWPVFLPVVQSTAPQWINVPRLSRHRVILQSDLSELLSANSRVCSMCQPWFTPLTNRHAHPSNALPPISTRLSNWQHAGRVRPAMPSNLACNHPPENIVHRSVMYRFSTPTIEYTYSTLWHRLTIIHAFTTYLFFSVDLTYRVGVILTVLALTCIFFLYK